MSFVKRKPTGKTVNSAGGVNPALEPNVGQYGWTNFDAANVNQIIQYVNICKNYADEAKEAATYIQGVYGETQEFIKYIEAVYEELKPLADGLQITYADIVARHEDIKVRHADIITKHGEVEKWHTESQIFSEEAEKSQEAAHISESNAKTSEVESEKWYDKSYELYEELRKGNIYRGTWNPHTNAYPNNGGTNSTWDVILNEGEIEFKFDNKTWFWGDRLVYLKEANAYQQIESGTTVTSVNGKKGAVVLSATDVNALPITGGELTGLLKGTRGLFSDNLEVQNSSGQDIRVRPRYIECGDMDASKTQELFVTSRAGEGLDTLRFILKDGKNPAVRWGSTNHAIYHQGYKPTAQDVGAVALGNAREDALNDQGAYVNSGSNFDEIQMGVAGLYGTGSGTSNIPPANSIGNNFAVVENQKTYVNDSVQMTVPFRTAKTTAFRTQRDGVFQPWIEYYTTAFKPTPQDIGAVSSSEVATTSTDWSGIVNKIPKVDEDGVIDLGRYIDLRGNDRNVDFDWRIDGGNLDYNGLDFYNTTGVKAFYLNGSTGDAQALRDVVAGRALRVNSPVHPTMELHAPGKHATMLWVDSNNGDTNISRSNGDGVESKRLAGWGTDGSMWQRGALRIPSVGAPWGAINPNGGIAPLVDDIQVAVGEWHPLITSPVYQITGQGYQTRWQIGHYRNVANQNGQFVINMTGDGLLTNNLRYSFGSTGQFSVEGTSDGSTYSLHSGGNLSGTIFGGYGTMVAWCQAAFAPSSDKELKRNIKPATKSALEDVAKIDFVSYDWKDSGRKATAIGVTAQQMEGIDESYAKNIETFKPDGSVDTSVKSLDTANCLALALKAIQEQSVMIAALQEEVQSLKEKLNVQQ